MAALITPKSARWYNRQGEPVYEVKAKSQPGMKSVTIREARELKLVPSVTTILQVLAKPELEAWKIEQGIMAALTLPRVENEPLDVFAKRVVTDMDKQVSDAADFGTMVHAAIEAHLKADVTTIQQLPEKVMPFLDEFIKWQESALLTPHNLECNVVNEVVGYAGRLDFYGRMDLGGVGECIIDFKTQKTRGKPRFYDEWAMQLAAYSRCICLDQPPVCVSVVVDSETPGPPALKIWDEEDGHWDAFLNAFGLWKYVKGFDPAKV